MRVHARMKRSQSNALNSHCAVPPRALFIHSCSTKTTQIVTPPIDTGAAASAKTKVAHVQLRRGSVFHVAQSKSNQILPLPVLVFIMRPCSRSGAGVAVPSSNGWIQLGISATSPFPHPTSPCSRPSAFQELNSSSTNPWSCCTFTQGSTDLNEGRYRCDRDLHPAARHRYSWESVAQAVSCCSCCVFLPSQQMFLYS